MRSDVHNAALRAAAKVAFSMAFLTTGCAAEAVTGTSNDNDENDDYSSTESDISKSKPKAPKIATGGCTKKNPPKQSCEQLINAAFPTEGDYPGTKKNVSSEVQACCTDLLTKPGADGLGMTAHRWDCCANATPGANIMMACTPWGPPVPPSMKRRGNKPTPPDAWIARFSQVLAEVA